MSFVGDVIGDVVGGITGSNKAAKAQEKAAAQSQEIAQQQFEQIQQNLSPYMEFGTALLPSLGQTLQPINRQAELAAYYQSPEFAMQSAQARNQQLAASEATGGLGATSTGNALAAIAPQLGQNYLGMREAQQADLYNRLMGGVGLGQSAAAGIGTAGQQYASQAAQALQQKGAAQAGGALAPFQTLMQIGSMAAGAYAGGGF